MTDQQPPVLGPDGPTREVPPLFRGAPFTTTQEGSATRWPALLAAYQAVDFVAAQQYLHAHHDLLGRVTIANADLRIALSEDDVTTLDHECEELMGILDNYSPDGYGMLADEDGQIGWLRK